MPDFRRLIAHGPSSNSSGVRVALTIVAILTVAGIAPVVLFGLGPIAVSTLTIAIVWLLVRRYR